MRIICLVILVATIFSLSTPGLFAEDGLPEIITLAEAMARALKNNPAVREAEGRNAAAQASADRVGSSQQVQLRLDSRWTYVSEVPTISVLPGRPPVSLTTKDSWLSSLLLQKVVYSGGKLEALLRQAVSQAKAVEAMSERARQGVAFEAQRAFLLLVAAQYAKEVADDSLAVAESHLRTAQSRYAARAAAHFDVVRAQVQVEEGRQEVIRAQSDIKVARAALARVLSGGDAMFQASEEGLSTEPVVPDLAKMLRTAREKRPELQSFQWQLKAAGDAVKAAQGERSPTVSLQTGYQTVSPESPMQFHNWSAGALMSVPIIDGGYGKARKHEAEAQRDQIAAARDSLLNAIAAEVRQAHARYESAASQIAVARARIEEAREALRIANIRYDAGVSTATEIADAQASLTRARFGLVRALTEWRLADAELRFAAGIPPIEQENRSH
jgi:outer membrane protein TolC